MPKILIIHPEGNINANVNLTAIVKSLCDRGYDIDLYSIRNEKIYQQRPHENVTFELVDQFDDFSQIEGKFDLIIGVDLGIIPAAKIARKEAVPYFLISYEIVFGDEVGEVKKVEEIKACSDIAFAICQDPVRSYLLARENKILYEKIFHIPVAGVLPKQSVDEPFFRKKFRIPKDKKIALYMGSIDTWAMIDELIDSVNFWPDDWVLILHYRYQLSPYIRAFIKKAESHPKIYISYDSTAKIENLNKMIRGVDLGIAFYRIIPKNKKISKNTAFIGLSSGKIASYLMNSVPVVTNEIGEMSDMIRENKIGYVFSSPKKIDFDQINDLPIQKQGCIDFFKNRLSLSLYENRIVEMINQAINMVDITVQNINSRDVSESTIERERQFINYCNSLHQGQSQLTWIDRLKHIFF